MKDKLKVDSLFTFLFSNSSIELIQRTYLQFFHTFFYCRLDKTKPNQLHFLKRWTVKTVRFLLYNHYYVHKLDTVFVNLQTSEVLVKVNKRYESVLSTQFGSNSKFNMSAESFQRVKQILKTREENYFRQMEKKNHRN